ncbi:MAG TPA: cupin domain-containing protein [Tepidiformaceae bacterium]|nr:cupin domain-containing protein [Tepidiformaceae bacterium]
MTNTKPAEHKSLEAADEVRTFERGTIEVVHLGNVAVGRAIMQPGWRWSEHVKPIAGTESCQASHIQYIISGRMGVRMDDGQELELSPGDAVVIPPGHDGWVIGDEPVVAVDWSGLEHFAER